MIVTVTVNPSVDRTISVERLARGEVTRASNVRVDPGGKGVNVSRALAAHGLKTRAVVPLGGDEGLRLAGLLRNAGIEVVPVPVRGCTRSNVAVVEPDGTTTKLNEPGATLSEAEVAAVLEAVSTAVIGADWLVISGSLPPGVPSSFYGHLARVVGAAGVRTTLDSSGPALVGGIEGRPALAKPNTEELAGYLGSPLPTLRDVIAAAHRMRRDGAAAVLVSLGADGAVLVDDAGVLHAWSGRTVPVSSVGAGDALLAGFLAAGGPARDALASAVAWGAAAVGLPGSQMPSAAHTSGREVNVTDRPDLDLKLA